MRKGNYGPGVDERAAVYTAADCNAYKILWKELLMFFLVDIILDTTTPIDTSGIRLVERIRKIPKYMFTPVLFITSLKTRLDMHIKT